MDESPPVELLESAHVFPGIYQIKAIGTSTDDFEARVVAAVRAEVGDEAFMTVSKRATPVGRHVSVTMDIGVTTAEQVRAIYGRIRGLEGLVMLL